MIEKSLEELVKDNNKCIDSIKRYQMVDWFSNIPFLLKAGVFAAVVSSNMVGCASTNNLKSTSHINEIDFYSQTLAEIGERVDEKYFFNAVSKYPIGEIQEFDSERKIISEFNPETDEVYNIESYMDVIYNDEDFRAGNKEFYLEDPFSEGRLIKIKAMGSDFISKSISMFSNPPGFANNPNLFANTDINEYHTPTIYIDESYQFKDEDNEKIAQEKLYLQAKVLIFHELAHTHIAQEIIGNSTKKTTLLQGINHSALGVMGLKSEDSEEYFHSRKLFETHSEITGAIGLKISEGMNNKEFFEFFKQSKSFGLGNDTVDHNNEHQSGMAFSQLFEFITNNPKYFDNMELKDVPYFSMMFTMKSGFYQNEKDRNIIKFLNNSEALVEILQENPKKNESLISWAEEVASYYGSILNNETSQDLKKSIEKFKKSTLLELANTNSSFMFKMETLPDLIKKEREILSAERLVEAIERGKSLPEGRNYQVKKLISDDENLSFSEKVNSIEKKSDNLKKRIFNIKMQENLTLNESVPEMFTHFEKSLAEHQMAKVPETHRNLHVPEVFPEFSSKWGGKEQVMANSLGYLDVSSFTSLRNGTKENENQNKKNIFLENNSKQKIK
jgi:hypothetical protein